MKLEERKNIARDYNENVLLKSWTYQRLTEEERKSWDNIFEWINNNGPLKNVREKEAVNYLLMTSYHSFLIGLGYKDGNWRS